MHKRKNDEVGSASLDASNSDDDLNLSAERKNISSRRKRGKKSHTDCGGNEVDSQTKRIRPDHVLKISAELLMDFS